MKYIEDLVNKSFITEKSRSLLKKHEKLMNDENLKNSTKESIAWTINHVVNKIGKPIEAIKPDDLSDYFTNMGQSETTKNNYKINMKSFFKRIGMKKNSECLHLLKTKSLKKLPKRLVDRKMLKKMLMSCSNSRDRALLFTFFETGARRSELLNIKRSDLIADEYGFVSVINGKTGERRIRLIEAAPDMKTWLNDHPDKSPDAPLWISLSSRGYGKRLHKESLLQIFKAVAERSGVDINVYPHLMRHSRATELASLGFSETQLNKFFGWEFGSPMPRVYIQRSGVDVDSKLLEVSGIKAPDKKVMESLRSTCPNCSKPQSPVASFCFDCGAILDTDAGKNITKKTEPTGIRKELEEMKDAIRKTTEYQEEMKKVLKELGLKNAE